MYKVSRELFDVLKSNGLVDNSHIFAADGFTQYMPVAYEDITRRKWSFGNSHDRQRLVFDCDYKDMYVLEGSSIITAVTDTFTENELKSIIAYFKLTHAHRSIIRSGTGNKIETWADKPSPSLKKSAAAKAFATIFDQVKF